jgi:2-polyprenyl-3-methyl-5-hydroxy-6-metoxy-1,4-benzoquinol methylase
MYSPQKIREIYVESDYAEHPYFEGADHVDELDTRRVVNFHKALSHVESLQHGRRLLDVGCGAGAFLSVAKNRGWQAQGVELSPQLANKCSALLGVPVATSTFEDAAATAASFDLITFWDVIEHVTNPMSCLQKAHRLLAPGGYVVFCTPDERSMLSGIAMMLYSLGYKYPSYALHPPNHTYFFSRRGFRRMLVDVGLSVRIEYSQEAFFEHSPLASRIQKLAIASIERIASLVDRQYEAVFIAQM